MARFSGLLSPHNPASRIVTLWRAASTSFGTRLGRQQRIFLRAIGGYFLGLTTVLSCLLSMSWSQSITGLAPFAPLAGGGAEIVNLADLNVHLTIPVVHKTAPGMDFTYTLNYDSTVWTHTYPYGAWTPASNWGWRGVSESLVGYITYIENDGIFCTNGTTYELVAYVDPVGTQHTLNPQGFSALCWPVQGSEVSSGNFVTTDGSSFSLTASVTNGVVSVSDFRDRSGNLIVAPVIQWTGGPLNTNGPGSITDPNGNQISTTGTTFRDTLDMITLTVSGTNPVSYTYTGPNYTSESVKVNYSSYTVATNFGCAADPEYPPTNVNLVSSIDMPDGTSYSFYYEPQGSYTTGRLSKVVLPTGASISYAYPVVDGFNITCLDGTAAGLNRIIGGSLLWQYVRSTSGTTTTTVTDPAKNDTVVQVGSGAEVQRTIYQGSSTGGGTLLETITTCYSTTPAQCSTPTGPSSSSPPAAITVVTTPNGGASSQVVSYLNANTLPTEIDTYDFGATSPTQKKIMTYATLNDGILDRQKCDQVVVGTTLPTACGTVTSNTKSLTTITWDGLGNLRGKTLWSGSGPELTSGAVYYSNGLSETVSDVNGNQTNYSYQNCNGRQAYPATVSTNGLTTTMTWDCNGGVLTEVQDSNNQLTQFGYLNQKSVADPFWRVLSVTDPLENITWNTYTPGTPVSTLETALAFNGNQSGSDTLLSFDGLGRLFQSQVRTTPSSISFDNTVQYGYKWTTSAGQTLTQTIPGGTALTTTQLDNLGRITSITDGGGGVLNATYTKNDVLRSVLPAPTGENAKQKNIEYDVFGRITSVCELTSTLPGYGTCTQKAGNNRGYFTVYTYDNPINSVTVTQNKTGTAQTRTFQYDGIGRLVSETNPETGTVNYTFDTDTTCGTSKGDLVKKVDAAGNAICYGYDVLHRVTSISYPSGPYSASTPSKTFVYDTSTFSCTNPNGAFVAGRLAEAYTGPSSAKLTDIGYCYSPRGEITDVLESTPNSNGYYHTTASYWANGALNTLSGVPGRNAWTFGVDGEGRPYSVVDGTTTNLVTSTAYNAASQPTGVNLGSGDSDAYTYDPNTGRMATYQYNVGSTPKMVNGTLGWNANWSLGSLVISDAFDSANSQNCAYAHDDLARLQSVQCGPTNPDGTTWGQTFSYDAFGNISKTGTTSFLPTYTGTGTTPTNQFYQLPGGPTGASNYYDSNGNLTTDLTNTYAWDADGNLIGINLSGSAPIAITYDAFDRAVEQNNSGTYKQVLYSPIGKLGLMTRQSNANVFLPLPGGEQATYTASTIRFRHYDWLGSARFESNMNEQEYGDVAYAPFGETYSIKNTPYLSFTGQHQDTISGLYDFLSRKYSSAQARWLSPDPAGSSVVDFSDPQTWNRYAYALNGPLNTVDPSGLCDVVIGGITQSPNTQKTGAITAFANFIGAELVFPYANGSLGGGLASVAWQALFGGNSASDAVAAAIIQAAAAPGPINIFTFSGGAQAYTTALASIPTSIKARINNVTYVSPGMISDLVPGNGSTTVISNPFGSIDNLISVGSVGNADLFSTECGHDSNCTFSNGNIQLILAQRAGNVCPNGGGGGGGGGDGGVGFVPIYGFVWEGGELGGWGWEIVGYTPVPTIQRK